MKQSTGSNVRIKVRDHSDLNSRVPFRLVHEVGGAPLDNTTIRPIRLSNGGLRQHVQSHAMGGNNRCRVLTLLLPRLIKTHITRACATHARKVQGMSRNHAYAAKPRQK